MTNSFVSLLEPLASPRPARRPDAVAAEDAQDDGLREDARAEAARLRAQAQAEADEIRSDARVQAEALREAAWQEGFHNGREGGRDAVTLELEGQFRGREQDLRAEVAALVTHIGAARQALWERQEAEMVAFVLEIARKVIKTEVTQNPEIVTHVIANALRRVADKELVRIKVCPDEAERLRAGRENLLALVDGIKTLEIVDDRRVSAGGCVIETNGGTIDAKIETQLAEIERALDVEASA